MMRAKFLLDYPGYPAGSVALVTTSGGLPPGVAIELQRRGIVRLEQPRQKQARQKKGK